MLQLNDIHSYDKDSLKSLKIPELKELCKKSDLSLDGKKDDLIQRILDFVEAELNTVSKEELDLNEASLNEPLIEDSGSNSVEAPKEETAAPSETLEKKEAEPKEETTTNEEGKLTETKEKSISEAKPETEATTETGVKKFAVKSNLTKEEEFQRLVKRAERFGLPKPDEAEFFKPKPEPKELKKDTRNGEKGRKRHSPNHKQYESMLEAHKASSRKKAALTPADKVKEEPALPFKETKLNFKKFDGLTEEEKLQRRKERFATGSK